MAEGREDDVPLRLLRAKEQESSSSAQKKLRKKNFNTEKIYMYKIQKVARFFSERSKSDGDADFAAALDDKGQLKLPLSWPCIQALFEHLSEGKSHPRKKRKKGEANTDASEGKDEEGDDGESLQSISVATLQGYKKALKFYYREQNVPFTATGLEDSSKTLDASIDTILEEHGLLEYKADRRSKSKLMKSSLSSHRYVELCKKIISLGSEERGAELGSNGLFGHAASTLMWNCCCSSSCLDNLNLDHFDWVGDSLKLTLIEPVDEGHEESSNASAGAVTTRTVSVFASPFSPETCPILALALYAFTHHRYWEGNNFFLGSEQKQRFGFIVQGTIPQPELQADEWRELGANLLKKSAVSFLFRSKGGPSSQDINRRANWTGEAPVPAEGQPAATTPSPEGDQLCGRILAGMDLKSPDFDVLSPHFTLHGYEEIEGVGFERFMVGYHTCPDSFKRCIPVFLANIIFHLKTLQAWFPMQHPVWKAPVFGVFGTSTLPRLAEFQREVVLCHGMCSDCGVKATGVPRDHAANVRAKKEVKIPTKKPSGIQDLKTMVGDDLTKLRSGLQEDILRALNSRIEKLNSEGVNREELENFKKAMTDDLVASVNARCDALSGSVQAFNEAKYQLETEEKNSGVHELFVSNSFAGDLFLWNGSYHIIPQKFRFPSNVNCKALWERWHLGQDIVVDGVSRRLGPLKRLADPQYSKELRNIKMKGIVSKANQVMNLVEETARSLGLVKQGEPISESNYLYCFDPAFEEVVKRHYGPEAVNNMPRYKKLSYRKVFDKLDGTDLKDDSGNDSSNDVDMDGQNDD